jgi:hypothetical protein
MIWGRALLIMLCTLPFVQLQRENLKQVLYIVSRSYGVWIPWFIAPETLVNAKQRKGIMITKHLHSSKVYSKVQRYSSLMSLNAEKTED